MDNDQVVGFEYGKGERLVVYVDLVLRSQTSRLSPDEEEKITPLVRPPTPEKERAFEIAE